MIKLKFLINKIYFISSLNGIHQSSAEDIFKYHIQRYFTESCFNFNVSSKSELINLLKKIKKETNKKEIYPLIHIESHGLDSGDGLSLSNNDIVLWQDLREIFTDINKNCRNNLFLFLSACFTMYIAKEFVYTFYNSLKSTAPFFGFIGTIGRIDFDDLNISLPLFYKCLSEKQEIQKAVQKMNTPFSFQKFTYYSCFHASIECINKFSDDWIKNRGYKFTVEKIKSINFYSEVYKYTNNRSFDDKALIETMISKEYWLKFLNKRMNEFLLVSKFPELSGRFRTINNIVNFDKTTPKMIQLDNGKVLFTNK